MQNAHNNAYLLIHGAKCSQRNTFTSSTIRPNPNAFKSYQNVNEISTIHIFMNIFLFLVALIGACVLANALRNTAVEKDQPPVWKKAETARWLAHENVWGTLSTSSVHLNGQAWGQPKSFVDGTVTNSTGILYFYDSDMDASMQDINANPVVAFSLSAAQMGRCTVDHVDGRSTLYESGVQRQVHFGN